MKFVIGWWTKEAYLAPIFLFDGVIVNQSVDIEEMNVITNQLCT